MLSSSTHIVSSKIFFQISDPPLYRKEWGRDIHICFPPKYPPSCPDIIYKEALYCMLIHARTPLSHRKFWVCDFYSEFLTWMAPILCPPPSPNSAPKLTFSVMKPPSGQLLRHLALPSFLSHATSNQSTDKACRDAVKTGAGHPKSHLSQPPLPPRLESHHLSVDVAISSPPSLHS